MTLFTALWNSEYGIATRRRTVGTIGGKVKYEYLTAFVDHRGRVHIANGRTGIVRRDKIEDRERTDWECFAESKIWKAKPRAAKEESPVTPASAS